MKRYDIHGNELRSSIQTTRCGECGMGMVDAAEFHPYEACVKFKETHDSREVWRMLFRLFKERILGAAR